MSALVARWARSVVPLRTSSAESFTKPVSISQPLRCVCQGSNLGAVASPGAQHLASRLMFDPGSCWCVRGRPSPPAARSPRGAEATRNPLQLQHRRLLALLSRHGPGEPGGDYKTPFIWGISRHSANIESLIPPRPFEAGRSYWGSERESDGGCAAAEECGDDIDDMTNLFSKLSLAW